MFFIGNRAPVHLAIHHSSTRGIYQTFIHMVSHLQVDEEKGPLTSIVHLLTPGRQSLDGMGIQCINTVSFPLELQSPNPGEIPDPCN